MRRKKSLPVHAVCKNCGTQLYARYCHICGQDVFSGAKRSVKDLAYNAIENIFVLDNKLLKTLGTLLFCPGRLSKEYRNGKISNYVHPSKLFWFITILFFAIFTSQITFNSDEETQKRKTEQVDASANSSETRNNEPQAKNVSEKKQKSKVQLFGGMSTTQDKEFEQKLKAYTPYAAFLLIPVFALLLALFFHKKDYFYTDHLAFALHFHSFLFLTFSIYILLTWFIPSFAFPTTVYFTIPLVYLTIALYVFYHPRKWSLLFKIIGLHLIYVPIILMMLIVGLLLALWLFTDMNLSDILEDLW